MDIVIIIAIILLGLAIIPFVLANIACIILFVDFIRKKLRNRNKFKPYVFKNKER